MVRVYILILFFCFAVFTNGQTVDSEETEMITFIEEAPLFNGDLKKFIHTSLVYPEFAISDSITGVVYVHFLIKKKRDNN